MTTKEIRDKDSGALNQELIERKKHLFELRGQAVTEKLEDPTQLRKTRKDIARIKTILRQRQVADAAKAQPKAKATTTTTTAPAASA